MLTVSKTSVEINRDIAAKAAEILGTPTLRETIDAALRDVVDRHRQRLAIQSFAGIEFDLSVTKHAWGGDHDHLVNTPSQ